MFAVVSIIIRNPISWAEFEITAVNFTELATSEHLYIAGLGSLCLLLVALMTSAV